jgi:hypothetical protein
MLCPACTYCSTRTRAWNRNLGVSGGGSVSDADLGPGSMYETSQSTLGMYVLSQEQGDRVQGLLSAFRLCHQR